MRVLSITRDRIPDEDAIEREQWLRYDSNEILFACAEQTKEQEGHSRWNNPFAKAVPVGMRSAASFLRRNDVLAYFVLTFFVSWSGALAVVVRNVVSGQSISKTTGLIIFPVMLVGPFASGLLLSGIQDEGLRALAMRLRTWRVGLGWYALLLVPPIFILAVLYFLKTAVSPVFSPNGFYFGILFGIPAGVFEEIGWTGYVYPRMSAKWKPLSAALLLGLLWSLWHLPAINFLGASAPHGPFWFRFFLAFGFAMTPVRVLICWLYLNTKSVLLAQLMHISSTASLVVFSPPVTPAQEALWYAIYGAVLWVIVGIVIVKCGPKLGAKFDGPNGAASQSRQISSSRS